MLSLLMGKKADIVNKAKTVNADLRWMCENMIEAICLISMGKNLSQQFLLLLLYFFFLCLNMFDRQILHKDLNFTKSCHAWSVWKE